jgi:hypothetical protein
MSTAAWAQKVPTTDDGNQGFSIAIGVNGGTTGIGGEVTTSISPKFNARVGFNTLSYNYSGSYNDGEPGLDYNADLSNSNFSGIVDFYPANRGFKLSLGVYYYDFEVSGTAVANESYTVNEGQSSEKTFSADRLGDIGLNLTYPNKFMPYAGLGFGNPVAAKGKLKLNFQVGVLYSGAPELTMDGDGLISGTVNHAAAMQEGLNEFAWHPVLNLGLSFKLR